MNLYNVECQWNDPDTKERKKLKINNLTGPESVDLTNMLKDCAVGKNNFRAILSQERKIERVAA